MFSSTFFDRTWESLLFLFLSRAVVLIVWLFFKPSLARDMESLSPKEAETYLEIYKVANPKIGRT